MIHRRLRRGDTRAASNLIKANLFERSFIDSRQNTQTRDYRREHVDDDFTIAIALDPLVLRY